LTLHRINGINLNVEQVGSGPSLVLLHGFTGSSATWTGHAERFGERFTTYSIDLIGHGRTDAPLDSQRYRMERCVEDLVTLFDELGIESTALLGYSLGARVALHLVVAAPQRIRSLILEGASPGIADPSERVARAQNDAMLAELIERDGLVAFVDRWQSQPLFESEQQLPPEVRQRHRAQRLANDPRGLANSLRGMGAGTMEPVWGQLHEIAIPVLLIAGELDRKYVEISTLMARQMPGASRLVIADAGHAPHLEAPAQFDRAVIEWFTGHINESSDGSFESDRLPRPV
jgi:2-succinyl-6-hydroxy-2,4-cyclohexadiene-1-carboxylate synthase